MNTALHAGEIDCVLGRLLATNGSTRWLGVFARDQVPDLVTLPRPFALVFNTHPSDRPGEHWLAIYGPRKGRVELFDSFGLPLSFYGLESLDLAHHRYSLQSYSSSLCGHYCILYIYSRSHGISLSNIVHSLLEHRSIDSFVLDYVRNLRIKCNAINPCLRTGQCCKIKCLFC